MEEKKVRFSGDGSELSAMMKKLQSDGRNMYESFAKEAIKLTSNQKEQSKIISDQIRLFRESLKIQKEITEERLKQAKTVLGSIPEGGVAGAAAFENMAERKAAQLRIDRISKELGAIKDKDKSARDADIENKSRPISDSRGGGGVFNDIMRAGLFRDLIPLMRSVPNQENGLGLVSPGAQFAGAAAGAAVGAAIDAANIKIFGTGLGDIHASTFMSQLGKEGMGFMGDAITRSQKIRDQFTQSHGRFRALGGSGGITDVSAMGYSDIDFADALGRNVGASGNSRNARSKAELQLGLSRGFGIEESVTAAAFGTERVGQRDSVANIQRALGIAVGEGLDRAKFSDAIINQTQLIERFSSRGDVDANDVNRLMFEFNKMGGAFGVGDRRSMGNISAIDEGLRNPSSRFFQARNYQILKELYPEADPMDLLIKQDKGLMTPGFLQKALEKNRASGYSPVFQELQLASQFNGLPPEFARQLYRMGPDAVGKMSQGELNRMMPSQKVKQEAEGLTSTYTRMNAEVVNAFREDFLVGIKALAVQFEVEMGKAIDEVKRKLSEDDYTKKDDEGRLNKVYNAPGAKTPMRDGYYRVKNADGSSVDIIKPPKYNGR